MEDISVQAVKNKLNAGEKFVFLDVRETWEFDEYNMGAQLIPLGELPNRMAELEDHKNDEIIVHCRSGARSATAKHLLIANGFTNVKNMLGGALEWQKTFG